MGHGAFDELPCSADGRLWMMDFIYVLRLRFFLRRVLTERCWYGEFRVLNWSGLIGELVSTRFSHTFYAPHTKRIETRALVMRFLQNTSTAITLRLNKSGLTFSETS